MPNRRGQDVGELEQAHPWGPDRFAEAEPQDRRGPPGSRGLGEQRRSEPPERHTADEWSGVNPLGPIDPSMPVMKPGDQGG